MRTLFQGQILKLLEYSQVDYFGKFMLKKITLVKSVDSR